MLGNKALVSRPENCLCIKMDFRILLYFKNSYWMLQPTSAGPSLIQKMWLHMEVLWSLWILLSEVWNIFSEGQHIHASKFQNYMSADW